MYIVHTSYHLISHSFWKNGFDVRFNNKRVKYDAIDTLKIKYYKNDKIYGELDYFRNNQTNNHVNSSYFQYPKQKLLIC